MSDVVDLFDAPHVRKTVIDVRCGVNQRLITNHLWPIRVVITFSDRFQATATLQVSLQ